MTYFSTLSNYLKSVPGFHTTRKIVVLESDDWGSIRMPSEVVFSQMTDFGFKLTEGVTGRYNKYDTLATCEDLTKLFEVLTSFKDSNGNYFVMTPMILTANPDFQRIKESDYTRYFYEPFTETIKSYYGSESSFRMWEEGIKLHIFRPQFHGREHLHVSRWLNQLQNRDKHTLFAFDHKMWGYPQLTGIYEPGKSIQAAFAFVSLEELQVLKQVIVEGLELFERLLGYKATYFVPPNGPLSTKLNENSV